MEHKEQLDQLRRAYQGIFDGPNGELVLKDLSQFCGMGKDCFSKDALEMAHNTGMRKAFLRIQNMLNITDQQIWDLFNGE